MERTRRTFGAGDDFGQSFDVSFCLTNDARLLPPGKNLSGSVSRPEREVNNGSDKTGSGPLVASTEGRFFRNSSAGPVVRDRGVQEMSEFEKVFDLAVSGLFMFEVALLSLMLVALL